MSGRNPITIRAEEGLGPHWTMLRDEGSLAIRMAVLGGDHDMYRAIMDHLHYLNDIPREPGENDNALMARLLAIFLDRMGSERREAGFDAYDAIFWMTDAEWDVETAMRNVLAAEERGVNPEEESGEESGSESDHVESPKEPEEAQDALDIDAVPEKFREINNLNPSIDRQKAIVGQVTPAKFTITLVLPENKGTKTLHFNKYNQGANMDWNNSSHIRQLNRWRAQQLRRDLGPTRSRRIHFHEDERLWLIELYRSTEEWYKDRGQTPDFKHFQWDKLTADFNHHFAHQIQNVGGEPRPVRSKASLMTERYRIPEVCRIGGLTLKTGKKPDELEVEVEEDDDEDGDDSDAEPVSTSKGKRPAKRGGKKG